jgi:tetratricopeptide (TPR) repeat protein
VGFASIRQMSLVITRVRWSVVCSVLVGIFALTVSCAFGQQATADFATKKQQADALFAQNKLEESEPFYEQLAADSNADWVVFSRLGFLLYSRMSNTRDDQQRKEFADRARTALLRARELGDRTALTNLYISTLANGTPAYSHYSDNAEADGVMHDAETVYLKGDMAASIELYKKALAIDPKLYLAAVNIGDGYYKTPGKQEEAQEWFAKAVAINPNGETAYRYWADDLMKLGKVQEARDKFVEAYITQPSNRLTVAALANWAKGQNITLAQPVVKIPITIAPDASGYVVTVPTGAMISASPLKIYYKPLPTDGNPAEITYRVVSQLGGGYGASLSPEQINNPTFMAWMKYAGARMVWAREFFQGHPGQTSVRNNLPEEALALRTAISQLDANTKDLDPSLATLMKLDKDGVLEAFIFLARADQGIMQDYPAYLVENRDVLRRYVMNWVFPNGGNQK